MKKMKENTSWLRFRIFIVLVSFIFVFIAIFIRAFQLQVLERDKLKALADRAHLKAVSIIPKRGTIYDRGMRELAVSTEVESVYAQPAKIENIKKTSGLLASALSIDRKELESKFTSKKSFVWVKRQLDFAEGEQIQRLNIQGIGFVKEGRRFYPNPQIAGHIIGFVGVDSKGLEGVELEYEEYMAGASARLIGERDAHGNEILFDSTDKDASKGMNLILTIDKTIQYIAEKELFKAVSNNKAKGGMVVVMDPSTGEILAMANAPHFKPNNFYEYSNPSIWRNKVVTDAFEPGSTFKTFLVAAAFEEGVAKPNDLFFCEEGSYGVADRVFHDVKKFGWLSLAQIIKHSSNIGAAKIGNRLGKDRFYRYINDFGFGAKTGIDLPGESSGSIPHLRGWSNVALGNISFGQGISVTGIQFISAFSAIANHGYLMRPYIVKEIVDGNGNIVKEFRPEVIRKVVSEETARKVTAILKEVTKTDGTGIKASIDGFDVAGKTGTAQKPDLFQGGYVSGKYISSFVGFVPADNPELVILVIIDEPSVGEFYGGVVAAPVFKEIATHGLAYRGVFPRGTHDTIKPLQVNLSSIDFREDEHEDFYRMPDLKGKTVRSVLRLAREIPLEVKVFGSGRAAYQRPLPGERITQDTLAEVWFK